MGPDTLGIHGRDIGGETGKRHGGAYKPRINSHVMGMDGGDRVGAGREAGREASETASQRPPATATQLSAHDPHPTRLLPTPSLADILLS